MGSGILIILYFILFKLISSDYIMLRFWYFYCEGIIWELFNNIYGLTKTSLKCLELLFLLSLIF